MEIEPLPLPHRSRISGTVYTIVEKHKLGNFTKQLKRLKNTRFCQLLHQFLHTSNTKAYPKQTKNSSVSYTTLRSSTYRSPDFVGNNNRSSYCEAEPSRSDTTTISTVTRHQARQISTSFLLFWSCHHRLLPLAINPRSKKQLQPVTANKNNSK